MPRLAPYLPDRALTPGMITAAAAAAIAAGTPLPATKRSVTHATKNAVFVTYGIPPADRSKYDIDHLVPLALGGSNCPANLWPQEATGPSDSECKDRLEILVVGYYAGGKLTAAQAVALFCTDWMEALREIVNRDVPSPSLADLTEIAPIVEHNPFDLLA